MSTLFIAACLEQLLILRILLPVNCSFILMRRQRQRRQQQQQFRDRKKERIGPVLMGRIFASISYHYISPIL